VPPQTLCIMNEEELKNELEELFYKKLNIENNLTKWVEKIKYQKKYGDMFIELSLPESETPDNIKTFVLTKTKYGFICRLGNEEDALKDGVNAIIIDGGGDYAGFWAYAQFVNYSDGINFKIDENMALQPIVSAYLSQKPVKLIING